ncbi:MAG: hypothetical protein COA73_01440 [Candidatus Hydrogenedentota bacterium]|nr:MAG: hypothetical protein COA73_01440 [Candidatus Hydrogenedentota bacterium]
MKTPIRTSAITIIIATATILMTLVSAQTIRVTAEEEVYTFVSPGNGSGPFWSAGCTSIARLGDRVFVNEMETGEGVPLLCNTRWRLLERDEETASWNIVAEATDYRQREPVSLAVTGPSTLYLNVNDSLTSPGEHYQACHPHLLKFGLNGTALSTSAVNPVWNTTPNFTDHSYRGFAADRYTQELFMLNIDARTSKDHYALLDRYGVTQANGKITFPIRSGYPYVALKNRAAHVLAIGDIVEPVDEWRTYKFEQTQRKWDYVFRISYYTWSPNLGETPFVDPIEIANVDATGGAITNQDMWIAPDGTAYIMYTQREVQSALLRDKFFPGKSVAASLHLARVKDGIILGDEILIASNDKGEPGRARFHETENGRLFAMVYAFGSNKLMQIYPDNADRTMIDIPFKKPFYEFSLATTRAGNLPSNTLDVLGNQAASTVVSYARIEFNK